MDFNADLFEEIRALAQKLVSIRSVNSDGFGERDIAQYIESYLRAIPYFQKHPEQIIIQPLRDDTHDRRNVFALIKGEREPCPDTILLHGHIDTVGVDDYGALQPYAFDCAALEQHLKQADLPAEVRADLESGEYLFGRGAGDMKSGDAVFLVLAKHLCARVHEFGGNFLLSFNPVEENLHTGIIEGLDVLEKLMETEHLRYALAINNDYICPLYPDDTTKYIYTGAVGKLLPCFYIQGKETHVGQIFEGFDAAYAAAELVRLIDANCDFCDGYKGEYTLPPSVLKMKELKEQYNVQTPYQSFVYFNYFVHDAQIPDIIAKLKAAAVQALANTEEHNNAQYRRFCGLSKTAYTAFRYQKQVLLYDELYALAKKTCPEIDATIERMTQDLLNANTDMREIPLRVVEMLCTAAQIKDPTVVLFFAAPYCPHNTLHEEKPDAAPVYRRLQDVIRAFEKESGETYKMMQFFQSLSDSSYLSVDDDEHSIRTLLENFPAHQTLYPVPLERIRKLNIPAVNFGCLCKDAHKWTERVHMPYSYRVLPKLLLRTFEAFLKF